VTFIERQVGEAALAQGHTELLPGLTLDSIREHRVALKGRCTTPIEHGLRSVNVALRQQLKLFVTVRPVRTMLGVKTRYESVDLVIVRENTERLYGRVENVITEDVVTSMKVSTRGACHRIADWVFRYATQRQRKQITVFHKANIMKMT